MYRGLAEFSGIVNENRKNSTGLHGGGWRSQEPHLYFAKFSSFSCSKKWPAIKFVLFVKNCAAILENSSHVWKNEMEYSECADTLKEYQSIPTFSTVSKNSDCSLQWWSMRKYIWEHKEITNTSGPEIILHNYTLHQEDLNYLGIFLAHLRMPQIFTIFPTGSGFQLCAVLEICKYQRHPQVYW